MMCEECGKNAASIKLVSVIGGEKHEKLICPECMAKLQKQFRALDLSGLAGILGGLIKQVGTLNVKGADNADGAVDAQPEITGESGDAETDELICMGCGTSYAQYKKTGFLGCPECYRSFSGPLGETLKRINGASRHIGRSPGHEIGTVSIRLDIDRLRHQLSRAITEEEYEQAADIRDRIKELKTRLEEMTVGEGANNE